MIKIKAIVFFFATFTCAWGRPQPNTVVWPRSEESLDSDIDALLQKFPDKNQMKPVIPSHSFTERPVDVEATPPSIFTLPPTPLHYTPSPEHFMTPTPLHYTPSPEDFITREPRFWSRIKSTTVGPHGGHEAYKYSPDEHDEHPLVYNNPANYPNLPEGHDEHIPLEMYNPTNYPSREGSVMPQNPVERNSFQPTSTQFRDQQSNPSESSPNLNPSLGSPWSWGSREGSNVHPPSPALPFNPEFPEVRLAAPIDPQAPSFAQPISHQFRDRQLEQSVPTQNPELVHAPHSRPQMHQEDIPANQNRMLRADVDQTQDQFPQKDEVPNPTQFNLPLTDEAFDQFRPVTMSEGIDLDDQQGTRALHPSPESSQQPISKKTPQPESLSERAAAKIPQVDLNQNIQSVPVKMKDYEAQVRKLQLFQNVPQPFQRDSVRSETDFQVNLPKHNQHQQRQALQSPVTARPWYMPRRANCRPIEKVVKVQQCEPYTVETCWKEARQECNPQPVTNCTGVVETKLEQVCFNVVDELCSLLETVQTEKTEDSYQVQDCFFGHENEVCGITHQVEQFDKDDYDCTTVKVLVCHQIPQYVHDVNCIESVEFDCKEEGYQPGTYLPEIVCTQNPIKNCYKIPRKVYSEVCETVERRHCEAFSNVRAMPVEKQTCKPYTKKSCDFKIETSPKINKNFNYEVVCRSKPREICEHVESKIVSPDCETSERLSCKYVPWNHQCKYDPKHYCHQVDKVVEEEVCDTVYGYAF